MIVQAGQALALETRASERTQLALWRRVMEHRIQTQGGNQAYGTLPASLRQFNNAVGLIAQHGDGRVR